MIAGVDTGRAIVVASAGGASDSVEINVIPVVPERIVLHLGQTMLLEDDTTSGTVEVFDRRDRRITDADPIWSSTDPLVATVSSIGGIRALQHGTTTIAVLVRGRVASASLTVATPYVRLSVGQGGLHGCGLSRRAEVYCWGFSTYGERGVGVDDRWAGPARVTSLGPVTTIATGGHGSCAVESSGALVCWGLNQDGQLGVTPVDDPACPLLNGHRYCLVAPTRVTPPAPIMALDLGDHTSCFLSDAGLVYCWGIGALGQLGDGTNQNRIVPDTVVGGRRFRALSVGSRHACALTDDGSAYCWGENTWGELGSPGGSSNVPRAVAGGITFRSISAGSQFTCGVALDGAGWCWGINYFGELGNGVTTDIGTANDTPAPILGGYRFSDIDAGTFVACGTTETAEVYCWGQGTTEPTRVSGVTSAGGISVGRHACTLDGLRAVCWLGYWTRPTRL